jgi:predicted O-linked N-acetylglucosamine transferase (SPINDLY family)
MPTIPVEQALALALQHHQAGRLAEAVEWYVRVTDVQPENALAWFNLGVAYRSLSQFGEAVSAYRKALELQPEWPEVHNNLANVLHEGGFPVEAATEYQRALALRPDYAEAHNNLGIVLARQRRFTESEAAFRRALELKPHHPDFHHSRGAALAAQARFGEAVGAYERALSIQPDRAEIWVNLGVALATAGRRQEAIRVYRRALEFQPRSVEAHSYLGVVLKDIGQLDEAVAEQHHALSLQPHHAPAYNNLGNALRELGRLDEALQAYSRAVALAPESAHARSNLICALHFHPAQDLARIAAAQTDWNRQIVTPLKPFLRPHDNDRDPDRRLRVGYVSPDFWSHAVSFFFVPLLEAHDRERYEIVCYSSGLQADAVTARLRQSADGWREVSALSDEELAETVRADGIDILVDLAMHTADNRLPAFARKPAPLQASWLAYPGSSGMEMIDFRLTDAGIDPEHPDAAAKEEAGGEAICLPDAWCVYEPIREFPPVGPLPAARSGVVTFGSLNQFGKINEAQMDCWARLMGAVPRSRLLLVCPAGQTRQRVAGLFARQGISSERLELVAPRPWSEYLRYLESIDLALDSFPCNGMTTTCHALWMGVPVITKAGASAASRAGVSLLTALGHREWIAASDEDYLHIAAGLAGDIPRLAELRAALRSEMQDSPLMDAPRFARHVEAVYRTMWQRWCATRQRG